MLRYVISQGEKVKSVSDPKSVGSHFGVRNRDFIEARGLGFTISNPRNRIVFSNHRKISLGFCIANAIWMLSGENSIERIVAYNKKGIAFSDNGIYYEAAFGDRIFGKNNQWEFAEKLLNTDINSRRIVIPIFFKEDLVNLPKDTPCAESIQLMVRSNKLDFFLTMRSQSLYAVFPYDIFLFTFLHEFLAQLLSLPIGKFYYYCKSLHIYEEELDDVEKSLAEKTQRVYKMPKMPKSDWLLVKEILSREEAIRENAPHSTYTRPIPRYWDEFLRILSLKIRKEETPNSPPQLVNFFNLSESYL